ncbi:peptidyl-tRNA hydrolase [Sparassis latifolia]|uniref:peptidyl-tRNA hydrolase n=1 Tax=Sparassis crispa TaxID=139825 RepID=A0A401GEP3_9APHY|nr:Peptidyl-tRNA hydrolase [Sparassis crispa]GBE80652.1 Peptidyl-tRNA hydrolase [Sparassis crispa]
MAAIRELLIVGLGNLPYPATRHSVGHLILDALASSNGMSLRLDRVVGGFVASKSDVPFGKITVSLTLFKPNAFMNISGRSVANALRKTVVSPSNLIVIHDDLLRKPSTLSHKFGGSANGHNGVKSIIAGLGGETGFHRLRIGIGREGDAAEYVLDRLPLDERLFWSKGGEGFELVCGEIAKIASRKGNGLR